MKYILKEKTAKKHQDEDLGGQTILLFVLLSNIAFWFVVAALILLL